MCSLKKGNFTFLKSVKKLQRTVEEGKKRAGGLFLLRIMEAFSFYKTSFVIFQGKKTARKTKTVALPALRNCACAKGSQLAC